jgi:hypothetical protein
MNAMRDQVRDLKEQYWRMLDLKERQMRGKEHDASALLAMTPTHRKAMKLHMQISRVKEELLAESAALQKMLEGQEAVTYRMSQLLLEMNQEVLLNRCACGYRLIRRRFGLLVDVFVISSRSW